jgi:hypothetical protein
MRKEMAVELRYYPCSWMHTLEDENYRILAGQNNLVGIMRGCELNGRISIVIKGTLQRPDRLWGPSSLLSDGYRGKFTRGKLARAKADH